MNQIPVILAYITILIGCSSNDDDNNDYPINGIEGTIIGEVGCTAIVFEAQITNPDHEDTTSGTIGILDVPEEFGQIGIKIRFDMRENTNKDLACVALSLGKFYEIKNVIKIHESL